MSNTCDTVEGKRRDFSPNFFKNWHTKLFMNLELQCDLVIMKLFLEVTVLSTQPC